MKAHNRFILSGIVVSSVVFGSAAHSQTWKQLNAPITNWSAIACSADGSKVVAAVWQGPIYTSTNSGSNWLATSAPVTNWSAVASSADGTRLLAAVGRIAYEPGPVFYSTNSGIDWIITSAPATNWWASVACSADGTKLVAVLSRAQYLPGGIYCSQDAGNNWSRAEGLDDYWEFWVSVGSSAAGDKLAVANYGHGTVTISTNFGATWVDNAAGIDGPPVAVASSADGNNLVAASTQGGIFTSTNGGAAWGPTTAPSQEWVTVASSADGKILVAAPDLNYGLGHIYFSTDSGGSWAPASAPNTNWSSVASSADGNRLFAAVNSGSIYAFYSEPIPVLKIEPSSGSFMLSWIVPSTIFALQQNPDLSTTNWTDVTAKPSLNYTNLNYELTLPAGPGAMFYRLAAKGQ